MENKYLVLHRCFSCTALILIVTPSKIFGQINSFNVEPLVRIINRGMTDFKVNAVLEQALLHRTNWAISFAEDYISKLEVEDGGWGHYTAEIVYREQWLLPGIRRKKASAETRAQHAKSLLEQFELIHRLLAGVSSRKGLDASAEDRVKMAIGMQLVDREWKKMFAEVETAVHFAMEDEKVKAPFYYRWQLVRPDGTVLAERQSNAMEGRITLSREEAECRVVPIIGGGALFKVIRVIEKPKKEGNDTRKRIQDVIADATADSAPEPTSENTLSLTPDTTLDLEDSPPSLQAPAINSEGTPIIKNKQKGKKPVQPKKLATPTKTGKNRKKNHKFKPSVSVPPSHPSTSQCALSPRIPTPLGEFYLPGLAYTDDIAIDLFSQQQRKLQQRAYQRRASCYEFSDGGSDDVSNRLPWERMEKLSEIGICAGNQTTLDFERWAEF